MTTAIGTFTLAEPRVYSRGYETASWYTDIEVQPGEYEVTQSADGYWALVTMPGKIVGSNFVNQIFHASSHHKNEDVGKDTTYTIQTQMFSLDRLKGYTPVHNIAV